LRNSIKATIHRVSSFKTALTPYRGFIGAIAFLGYLLAAVAALSALISGFTWMRNSFRLGLVVLAMGAISAAMLFLLARFFKEAALVLVDIGDSVAEANVMARSVGTEAMSGN
jgi:hypothetical protein